MNINEHLEEPTIKPVVDLLDTPVVVTAVPDAPIDTVPVVSPYKLDTTLTLISESFDRLTNQKAIANHLKTKGTINKDTAEFVKQHFTNVKSDVRLSQESFTNEPSRVNLDTTIKLVEDGVNETQQVIDNLIKNDLLSGFTILRNESEIRNSLNEAITDHLNTLMLKTNVLKAIATNTNTIFYGGDDPDTIFNIATTPLFKIVEMLATTPALDDTTKELIVNLNNYINTSNFSRMYYALKESVSLEGLKNVSEVTVIMSVKDVSLSELLDVLCNKGLVSVLQTTEPQIESSIKYLEEAHASAPAILVTRAIESRILKFLTNYHVDVDNVIQTTSELVTKLEPLLV